MAKGSWMRLARSAVLLCALAVALGCFEYSETIKINLDGSGTVEIKASIPEKVAKTFRMGEFEEGSIPPPVSEGLLMQLMTGSANVRMSTCDYRLEDDTWKYEVVVQFDTMKSLSAVRYFKQRGLTLGFADVKELHFRQDIYPPLVQMAITEAKALKNDAYSRAFLAVVDSPDFKKVTENARMRYEVVMPGTRTSAPFDGDAPESLPDGNVRASKSYKMTDFAREGTKQVFDVRVEQPTEKGFLPVVITLLLASIVGILIPAARLMVIKSKRAA